MPDIFMAINPPSRNKVTEQRRVDLVIEAVVRVILLYGSIFSSLRGA